MIHYVHVIHVDPERAAAAGKALLLFFAAWLAWHFLPESWFMLNASLGGWPDTLLYVVAIPFVFLGRVLYAVSSAFAWVVGAVDSAFRIAAVVQAVLLPVWAVLAGRCLGRSDLKLGWVIWVMAAGVNAVCAVLLGYPVLAGMAVVGSLALFLATMMLVTSTRSWTGWLAGILVAGLSAWGATRYGTAFLPLCWPLVSLSWCGLALGAAYGLRCEASGWRRDREAARLLLVASAVAVAAVSPFAVNVARTAEFMPGAAQAASLLPAPAPAPAPAVAGHVPAAREPARPTQSARQPGPDSATRTNGHAGKPAVAPSPTRPRT